MSNDEQGGPLESAVQQASPQRIDLAGRAYPASGTTTIPVEAPDVGVRDEPDKYSKTGPSMIPNGAPHQIFRFCALGLDYGTDDKGHAAALILSVLILFTIIILFILGAIVDRPWMGGALQVLGAAFTFTVGIAIGKGTREVEKKESESDAD